MFYEHEAVALVLDKSTVISAYPSTASLPVTEPATPLLQTRQPACTGHLGHHGHHHHGHHITQRHPGRELLSFFLTGPTVDAPENEGELARCLVTFSSKELDQIKGLRSNKFREVLGYECDPEVAHREDIIFVSGELHHFIIIFPSGQSLFCPWVRYTLHACTRI